MMMLIAYFTRKSSRSGGLMAVRATEQLTPQCG